MNTGERTVEAEGLKFTISYRRFGGDQGPAICVWGDVGGKPVQLLRFDCFDKSPHYHYDPDGADDHRNLDKQKVADPVEWSLNEISRNLPEMVAEAGQREIASKIDRQTVAAAVPKIRAALGEIMPTGA
ncbi:MAG: hypothetical protein IT210_09695 [Armatimonadetes bacterium]|nr:hypothetical protein [Armatimonadota bacterium]